MSWGITVLGLLSGCGKATNPIEPLGAAGADHAGPGDADGAAGDGNSGEPAVVTEPELAPGTCGVVRRIGVSDAFLGAVTRQANAFSIGPLSSYQQPDRLAGELLSDGAPRWRTFSGLGSVNDPHWSFMLSAGPKLAEIYVGETGPSGEEDFGLRIWSDGDEAPTRPGPLLRAWWRGTDGLAVRPSLDGEHAVFAIWPTGISEPRAALIGVDGARIGEALSLAPPDHKFSSCEGLTPTLHGGVVSFVDTDDHSLHLVELGGSEGSGINVNEPWSPRLNACPTLSVDDTGVSYLVPLADDSTLYQRYHAGGAGTASEERLSLRGTSAAFTSTPRGTLVLEYVDGKPALELLAPPSQQTFVLDDGLGIIRAIPSEPGRLFVESQALDGSRSIVELGCN